MIATHDRAPEVCRITCEAYNRSGWGDLHYTFFRPPINNSIRDSKGECVQTLWSITHQFIFILKHLCIVQDFLSVFHQSLLSQKPCLHLCKSLVMIGIELWMCNKRKYNAFVVNKKMYKQHFWQLLNTYGGKNVKYVLLPGSKMLIWVPHFHVYSCVRVGNN